jgi:tRNA1Val (adenine37-N6)-methyltransferase
MANTYFEFKEFTIYQDKAAMKVGTDGVLLGAWAHVSGASRILDIGTGTGLIAIMCAQKNTDASIEALEIDDMACEQARENIASCPWSSRLRVINKALQDFTPEHKYDSIISNPPFFVNSTKTACNKKTQARHNDTLPFEKIIAFAIENLNDEASLSLILPVVEGDDFISKALAMGMFLKRKCMVIPKPGAKPKRILMELSLVESQCEHTELTSETEERHYYTEAYKALTGDFYARMK